MIKRYFNKTISILLTMIFLFGLFPPVVFAGPTSQFPTEIMGSNKTMFDNSFSKADREINPERWLSEAKLGLSQIIYSWELIAFGLYEDPSLFKEAKISLEKWSNDELEARFSNWLIGRFFGEAAEKTLLEFSQALNDTQKKYTWHLDSEGNIIFDDKTGDPLVIRPGDDNREFTKDISKWKEEIKNTIDASSNSYENIITQLFPELLAYIPPELREKLSALIFESASVKNNAIKREFENIAAREERIFTSRRTRDIWSLRNKSENEAAKLFTERLITETDEKCRSGIDELNIRIEQAEAGIGDLALLGEEWLRLYKEQFEKGLKAWEDAEERFFIRRIEWEQDSLKLFSEGEEVWLSAFNQFEEERQKWELNAKILFQAGETLFINLSEDFEKNIAEAKKEFELNMAMRIGEGTTKVKALIDMYLTYSSTAISIKETIYFWQKESRFNEKDPSDLDFSDWLSAQTENYWYLEAISEIESLYNTYLSYIEKAVEIRDKIFENYAELLNMGTLKDILSPDASSEDFHLDEYQIALVRAKALILYWERKTAVAEAVINYADDLSSNRMTEAEGIRAWEEAKEAYNKSLADYETELKILNEKGLDIKKHQELLSELVLNLQKEEEKLNTLNNEYNLLISLTINSDANFYKAELNENYYNLVNEYRNFEKTGEESVYNNVLINGLYWGAAQAKQNPDIEWQKTLDPLVSFFNSYGFDCESYYLPDIQDILEIIFNSDGDFAVNSTKFLLEFDNCFSFLPKWLETEIINWKNTFINYISVYALYFDEKPETSITQILIDQDALIQEYNEYIEYIKSLENLDEIKDYELELLNERYLAIINERNYLNYIYTITSIWENAKVSSAKNNIHWRQSIKNEYFNNLDYLVSNVSSWSESILIDSFFNASYYTNRLNDAFILYSQKDTIELNDDASFYYLLYLNEYSLTEDRFNSLLNKHVLVLNSINSYELSQTPMEKIKQQIEAKEKAKNAQKEIYKIASDLYFEEAIKFKEIGYLYDEQYSILKNAYAQTELKKFEYEKQDAIQRWASTSYINSKTEEYENNKIKLQKAQIVLEVLSNLYNDNEKRVYEDPKYDALFSAYEEGFKRKLTTLSVVNSLSSSITYEIEKNNTIFKYYQDYLSKLGNVNQNYTNYILPANRSIWSGQDIIMLKDGRLAFTRNELNQLTGVNASIANELNSYFNEKEILPNEKHEISQFEIALKGLSERMLEYFSDKSRMIIWSLARNYLIGSLIEANGDISFLQNIFSDYGELTKEGSIGSQLSMDDVFSSKESLYSYIKNKPLYTNPKEFYSLAWNLLSPEEKKDLEFYIIITLSNSSKYSEGFSLYYTKQLYEIAYNYTEECYEEARQKSGKIENFLISFMWDEMKSVNKTTLNNITEPYNEITRSVNNWMDYLKHYYRNIIFYNKNYTSSCRDIDIMLNIKTDGEIIVWEDINKSLLTAKIKQNYIDDIKIYWEAMQNETPNKKYNNVPNALSDLLTWTENKENISKIALNNYWNEQIQTQQKNENDFLLAVDSYISGGININTLKKYAKTAYGSTAASWKNHYANMHTVLFDDISLFTDAKYNFLDKFSSLGNDLLILTKDTMENKYLSEYAVREAEWQLMQNDILIKYNEWQNTASIILENGRIDWITSLKKMEDAYKQWYTNFQNEYERVNNEWNEIYLAGLEDKEKWLERASNAANQASSEALLSLVGTEGERLSRFVDTREPLGIRDSIPQAQSLMNELLQSPGITSMASAFNTLTSYAGITSPLVRRGMGGLTAWDAASVKIAASDLAKKSNSLIADNEAKILAFNVQKSINEAINGLTSNVEAANTSFRESMDNLFVFKGLWRKNGDNYVKDVVKGSTLFSPVISETVNIQGYINYKIDPINLKTNLNEYNLINLSSIAINTLIENAYNEVEKLSSEIFGFNEKPKNIKSKGDKREQSPGKFGTHIGYTPDTKPEMSKKRGELFYDEGKGELGRLMAEFTYWRVIDSYGMNEVAMAPWDKRIWNDEGSWFTAPSLRTVGDIACTVAGTIVAAVGIVTAPLSGGLGLGLTIASAAVIAGINTADDAVFNTLDTAYGYKSWDTAAFEVGKTYSINFASSLISGAFGGFGGSEGLMTAATNAAKAAGAANTIISQTIMAGTQTITTGIATSVLSGVTYSSKDGLGFSGEIAAASLRGVLSNSLVSMASALTSSSLTSINSGVNMEKLKGFEKLNQSDLQKLNSLAGSFAGQGVNYALGNDFTLNLLNLSQLTGGQYNSGLLELNLGRNGTSMNFGTGGADVSIDNLAAAFRGAQVWDANNRISSYIKKQGKEGGNSFDSYVTLRAQYGYGDAMQKDQLFDILKGDVTLNTDAKGDYAAETTLDGNNKRVINLAGYQQGMSTEDQFLLAVVLGHEAYRDGVKTNDNYLETRAATLAHTQMALRILAGGEKMTFNDNLMNDITAYAVAYNSNNMSLFNNYVDANYDSSADYWRVIMNANGSVDKILWDGDYTNATIVEADGTERFLPLQAGSVTQALSNAIGNGITKNQVNSIMLKSGLDFNNETKQWYAKEEYSIYTPPQIELPQAGSNPLKNITDYIGNKAGQALDAISSGYNNIKNLIGGLFGKGSDTIENTVNSKKGNTFTMKDSNENEIQLYLADKENHVLGGLLQQTDPAFASIPAISEAGCNFLATIAYAQLVTGKALSSEQIISIWKEAEKNPDILRSGGYVQDQNKLAEMALQKLGRTDIGLNFGGAVNNESSTLIGYRVTVDYNTNNFHHTTGDILKQILWNPDIRNTNTEIKFTRSVYVYAKN